MSYRAADRDDEPSHLEDDITAAYDSRGPLSVRIRRVANEEVAVFRPRAHLAQLLAKAIPQLTFNHVRSAILRAGKLRLGTGSLVMGELNVFGEGDWNELLSIGAHTYITGPLHINLGESVRIGDRVNIGSDVMLLTVDHHIGDALRRAGSSKRAPITIGDGAWIGSGVTVLPGVSVGESSVIAAGSVVRHDVPAHALVAGVPARFVRDLRT